MEVSAIKKTIPTFEVGDHDFGPNGTTSQTAAAAKNMAIGAPRKIQRSPSGALRSLW
jgi:hypothetical protein